MMVAAIQVEALPNMKNYTNCFEKQAWGYSYRSKDSDLIKMVLTKSNDIKYYCGTCNVTGYTVGVTYEENLIDSICVVYKGNLEDFKKSSETRCVYDSETKTHVLIFNFGDEDTRIIFAKLNDGFTQAASFQTNFYNK